MTIELAQAQIHAKAKIFVSYSRKDFEFVDKLDAALKAREFDTFVDRSEIYAFEDWWKRIQGLIAKADTVIFTLSPDAVASDVCAKEVAYAAALNKRFAPIVYRRVPNELIPEVLRRLNFVFFDEPSQFEVSANQLAEALITDIAWIRRHTDYGESAQHWSVRGRPGGLLLRSPELEDAERWIASRPANAPLPTEEIRTFIAESRRGASRRRSILTGGLAAGLVLALALAGLAYWQRGVAVAERKHAITSLNAATRISNNLIYDLADRFRHQTGVPAALVKDILNRAQKLQDELVSSGQSSPELIHSQASALSETSMTLMTIGDRAGALATADRARQILEALLTKEPTNASLQLDLGVVCQRLGDALEAEGKRAEAISAFEDGRVIHQKLVDADAGNNKAQNNLAVDYFKLGDAQEEEEKLDGALTFYRRALAIREMLIGREKLNGDYWRDLGSTYERVGDVLVRQDRLDQAFPVFQKRLDVAQALADQAPANTEYQEQLATAHDKIGGVLSAHGKAAESLSEYNKALIIRETLAANDPANLAWRRDCAISNNLVGKALAIEGKLDDALTSLQKGLAIEEELAAHDHGNVLWQQDLLVSYAFIGHVLAGQSKFEAALASFRKGLDVSEQQVKPHPDNAYWRQAWQDAVHQIGAVSFGIVLSRNFALALEAAEQAFALAPDMIWIQGNRAHALMFLDRTDEARSIYLKYRGRRNVEDQNSWETMINADFVQLRKAGLDRPLMDEIEKRFRVDE
jgi:tetratricopeptide (TPR) repeat protein